MIRAEEAKDVTQRDAAERPAAAPGTRADEMAAPATTGAPAARGPHRLWGGRFQAGPAPSLEELNRSLPVDRRLWAEDVEASRAWVQALGRAGVLDRQETSQLDHGLRVVHARLAAGDAADAADEDIHTLVERLLYEEVGEVAGKLHTGRSRNDQVATDTRLWTLRTCARLEHELVALQVAIVDQAARTVDILMPSYTHMRRAQPVRVAQWLLAHFWALQRDRERLAGAVSRVAVLPLGSGAIAGSGFPVDRTLLKELLGFRSISPNALDAVGDRDWVCEMVFVASMIAAHLSRVAEDLIIFSTEEFGFVRLPDAYTTGSSLMPQKRNPDGLELARGIAARLVGEVAGALALLKGIPSGYNKDLQEDKRLLFSAMDSLLALLPATRETIAALEFDEAALAEACQDEALVATDLADELVRRGVPFRDAHHAVGRLVRQAESSSLKLSELPDSAWRLAHPAFLEGGRPTFTAEASVESRGVAGGTSRAAVVTQLRQAYETLA